MSSPFLRVTGGSQPRPCRTRSTNQYDPASSTTTEPTCRHPRRRSGQAPTQQPEGRRDDDDDRGLSDLHAQVEREQRYPKRRRGQSGVAQHAGEAEPVHQAEQQRHPDPDVPAALADKQVVGADEHDAQRDQRLDDVRRRRDDRQRGQHQRDAVAEGEGRDDRRAAGRRRPPGSSSPTRNRMWSGPIAMWWMPDATKRRSTASTALPGARVVVGADAVAVEHFLPGDAPRLRTR